MVLYEIKSEKLKLEFLFPVLQDTGNRNRKRIIVSDRFADHLIRPQVAEISLRLWVSTTLIGLFNAVFLLPLNQV